VVRLSSEEALVGVGWDSDLNGSHYVLDWVTLEFQARGGSSDVERRGFLITAMGAPVVSDDSKIGKVSRAVERGGVEGSPVVGNESLVESAVLPLT